MTRKRLFTLALTATAITLAVTALATALASTPYRNVSITWPAVAGATGYTLSENGTVVSTTTRTSAKFGVTPGVTVTISPQPGTGTAEPTLLASDSTSQPYWDVTVDWPTVAGATGYVITEDGKTVATTTKTQAIFGVTAGMAITIVANVPAPPAPEPAPAPAPAPSGPSGASPPETSPSGPWSIAPPSGNVTTVSNPSGLDLNVNGATGQTFSDYRLDGGGDSSVLIQGGAHGNTFDRFRVTRTAADRNVSYGAHGFYVYGYANSFNDISMDNAGGTGDSAFSDRQRDNTFTRTETSGYKFCFSYFEEDSSGGVMTVRDAKCSFTEPDTAVWVDVEGTSTFPSSVHESFLFDHADFSGASGAKFFRASGKLDSGTSVTVICSTINGRAVTPDDVAGVGGASVSVRGC